MFHPIPRPEELLNRELSWLNFNARVMEEAEDSTVPLLERVKFLSIVSSNWDEFFMVRVAGIWRQIDAGITQAGRTLDNTARATVQLEAVVARIGRSADAVEKMGNEVARTSLSAGKAVDAVGADVKRFSTETLPELERLLGELGALSTSLRRLSEQTTRDPRGLIFGRTPVPDGPGEKGGAP